MPDGRPDRRQDGRIDERAIDRRLLAQLIARHGEPQRARRLTPEQEERRMLEVQRARALAAADPELIHHIERHERSSESLTQGQDAAAAAEAHARPFRAARGVYRAGWEHREIGDPRELEPSEELRDAMEHRTPQAFLRDLHRPVWLFGEVKLRRAPSPTGAALARAAATVRAAMSRTACGAGTILRASQLAEAGRRELRELLARPWQESRPENPLPMPSRMPGVSDWQWFGLSGGYDPDL